MPTKRFPNRFSFDATASNRKFIMARAKGEVTQRDIINAALDSYRKRRTGKTTQKRK